MEEDTLSVIPTLYVDSTALYQITVQDKYGCQSKDTVDVIIFGNPPVTISADFLVCGAMETLVNVDFGTYPPSLWTAGSFEWSGSEGLIIRDSTDAYATVIAPAYGVYKVYYKLTTDKGCVSGDTIEVQFSPGADLSVAADKFYDCVPNTITLTGNSIDATSYLWQNMDEEFFGATSTITVDSTGFYQLTVENSYGCKAKDTVEVIIFGKPPVTLSADSYVCGNDELIVTVDFKNYPDSLWTTSPGDFNWNSNGLTLVSESDSLATFTAMTEGIYEIYYELITKDLCSSGDTIQVQFYPQPVAQFDFDFQPICKSYDDTLRFTGVASPAADLDWKFERAQLIDTLSGLSLSIRSLREFTR